MKEELLTLNDLRPPDRPSVFWLPDSSVVMSEKQERRVLCYLAVGNVSIIASIHLETTAYESSRIKQWHVPLDKPVSQ